ncbi:MAG: DUF4350 domain-containing protein [Burkholderiales bacterium]
MKSRLLHAAAWLLAIAFAIWLIQATEWVDEHKPTRARGEALTNPLYAAQTMLRALGATVVQRQDLDEMPPPRGQLILLSNHWDLFEGREERLHDWVEKGGHLVIPGPMALRAPLKDWLPLSHTPLAPLRKPNADEKDYSVPARDDCVALAQSPDAPERYFDALGLRACGTRANASFAPQANDQLPLWSMVGPKGAEMLRVPFGRGTVTVIADMDLLRNDDVLQGDNPLIVVAALQAVRGADLMFVAEESREPFMSWLWQRGWVAIMLALLALAAALWRAAVRFGPLAQPAAVGRRSIAEQVRGTAAFLRRHGGESLHAAQLRALSEAAARRLHRAKRTPIEYARAIGTATGLDATALATALATRSRKSAALAADLKLLETARRRLETDSPGPAATAIAPTRSASN